MSLPEVMLFTDKGFESESTSDSPLKSFQKGIFTVVPPSVPKATFSSSSPTMPDCHNADFSAVLFNTLCTRQISQNPYPIRVLPS